MTLVPSLVLAEQIRVRSVPQGGVDHLKLQKLCFYVYGAALGLGIADGLGEVRFEAWKHGPVNRDVWDKYKAFKAEKLPTPDDAVAEYANPAVRELLDDVLEVYGRLSSWSIRCESHLEEPWIRARRAGAAMSNVDIRDHFAQKFAAGRVMVPVHLGGSQSAAVDGVPRARFESLHAMAEAFRAPRS